MNQYCDHCGHRLHTDGRLALTPRQQELLDGIRAYIRDNQKAPALHEIARRFGYASLSGVHEQLVKLEQKGWIKRTFNINRSIELI